MSPAHAPCVPPHPTILEVVITEGGNLEYQDITPNPSDAYVCTERNSISHTARLYLSETLDAPVERFLSMHKMDLPLGFAQMHAKNTIATWEANDVDPGMRFFVKWIRPVTQLRSEWAIEQRILLNRPYDVDTIRDPMELRLDHKRYGREPSFPFRPYYPITVLENVENDIMHATIDCVSVYLKRVNGTITGTDKHTPSDSTRSFC